MAHKIVLWEPTIGCARGGRKTYVYKLKENSGLDNINDTRMWDRDVWRDKAK